MRVKRTLVIEFVQYDDSHPDFKKCIGGASVYGDGKLMGAGAVGRSWNGDLHKGIDLMLSPLWWSICRFLAGTQE